MHECVTGPMTPSDFARKTMSSASIRIEKLTPPTLHSTFYGPLFITSSWFPFVALNVDFFQPPVLAVLIAPFKRASLLKSQSQALLALKCLSEMSCLAVKAQRWESLFYLSFFSLFLYHGHCDHSFAGPHSNHALFSPEKLLCKDYLVQRCGIKQVSAAGRWR